MHAISAEIAVARRLLGAWHMAPVQITFHGIQHSDALTDYVHKKSEKLSLREHGHCRVAIEQPHKSSHSGNAVRVRIDLGALIVDRQAEADAYAAVDAAFDDAERALREAARRERSGRKSDTVRRSL
jgi:putative sigma-54 modulation protein